MQHVVLGNNGSLVGFIMLFVNPFPYNFGEDVQRSEHQ